MNFIHNRQKKPKIHAVLSLLFDLFVRFVILRYILITIPLWLNFMPHTKANTLMIHLNRILRNHMTVVSQLFMQNLIFMRWGMERWIGTLTSFLRRTQGGGI